MENKEQNSRSEPTESSRPALLPCPFCDDEAVRLEDGRVFCGLAACGAFYKKFATPEQWNRRPIGKVKG